MKRNNKMKENQKILELVDNGNQEELEFWITTFDMNEQVLEELSEDFEQFDDDRIEMNIQMYKQIKEVKGSE